MNKSTINHTEIRNWAEKHAGNPALITPIEVENVPIGIRINFPETANDNFLASTQSRNISWDEFFSVFEKQGLAFVYNTEPKTVDPTYWYMFEKRSVSYDDLPILVLS
ncbi:MAG: hypothetical protein ACOZAO_02050 [Patescibacteria group bacterium]